MKLTGYRLTQFLRAPDPAVAAILVYGPDRGLVQERIGNLTATLVADSTDPFAVADLPASDLQADPARLGDEAAAMSFGGGRRLVHVRGAGASLAEPLAAILPELDASLTAVVVDAGDLGPRDRLRKLFEDADNAVAVPCYLDEGEGLEVLIRDTLADHRLKPDAAALDYLSEHLGGDRLASRGELDKLALYMRSAGPTVHLEDVQACIGDGAPMALDDVVLAVASGDQTSLERALSRCLQGGEAPVTILRAVARHLQRLHLAAARIERGQTADEAIRALRPPVFFKHQAAVRAQLRQWSAARLAQALEIILQAELDCKTTGLPDHAVCGRALMRLAHAARAGAG